jgi:hypothetical protein
VAMFAAMASGASRTRSTIRQVTFSLRPWAKSRGQTRRHDRRRRRQQSAASVRPRNQSGGSGPCGVKGDLTALLQ